MDSGFFCRASMDGYSSQKHFPEHYQCCNRPYPTLEQSKRCFTKQLLMKASTVEPLTQVSWVAKTQVREGRLKYERGKDPSKSADDRNRQEGDPRDCCGIQSAQNEKLLRTSNEKGHWECWKETHWAQVTLSQTPWKSASTSEVALDSLLWTNPASTYSSMYETSVELYNSNPGTNT